MRKLFHLRSYLLRVSNFNQSSSENDIKDHNLTLTEDIKAKCEAIIGLATHALLKSLILDFITEKLDGKQNVCINFAKLDELITKF